MALDTIGVAEQLAEDFFAAREAEELILEADAYVQEHFRDRGDFPRANHVRFTWRQIKRNYLAMLRFIRDHHRGTVSNGAGPR